MRLQTGKVVLIAAAAQLTNPEPAAADLAQDRHFQPTADLSEPAHR